MSFVLKQNFLQFDFFSDSPILRNGRHDTQHNDIQMNDTQQNN